MAWNIGQNGTKKDRKIIRTHALHPGLVGVGFGISPRGVVPCLLSETNRFREGFAAHATTPPNRPFDRACPVPDIPAMNRTNRSALVAILALAAAALQACAPDETGQTDSATAAIQTSYDWLIAGGSVVDGTGEPARSADVLLRGGRIAFVGLVDADTLEFRQRYDATGLLVSPGFIDAHAHGDPTRDPAFPNFLAMGVTTIVLGQDGSSPEVQTLEEHFGAVDAARPAINIAYLVGHNTIRRESGVGFDAPGSEGMVRMSELVERGLASGAFGLSTGL